MENAIIVLILVGFLMIAAEVFVPGLVLGIIGGLSLLTAIILCYFAFGPLAGTAAFAALALLTTVGFFLWLWLFPQTPIGRRLMLNRSLPPQSSSHAESTLTGASGTALTPLRPAGTARFGNRRVDVVAESGFIEPGDCVVVVFQEGLRTVVRKMEASGTPEKQD